MPETDSNENLRAEFNRWAESGRGEEMEESHLPITLPVLDLMKLAPDDNVLDAQGIKVYIDKHSAPYLEGSEIDFVDNNMMGAGFAIKNPNVKSSCGCGQSHRF